MGKKIPTILGLFILIGGIVAGIILVNMRQGLDTKAGPTESPKNIKISNKGSSTFSVSWTTDVPLTGFVKYSDNPAKINLPSGDVRDQISGTSQGYTNHLVNITGLNAGTSYYFLIGSGSQTYDDGGNSFQVRTGAQVIAPPEDVIFGKIVGGEGNPTNGAIVHVEAEGGDTLTAMTKNDGSWRLNLANSRDKGGKILTYDSAKTLLSIFVQAGSAGTATAITDVSKAKPVADIVLGKNQSFIESTVIKITDNSSATVSAAGVGGFQSLLAANIDTTGTSTATGAAKILNPAIEGEIIATSSPQFKGSAPAGTTVKITVNSVDEHIAVVRVDQQGTWVWTPPQPLTAGNHNITIEYTDSNNMTKKISRSFTILSASDSFGIPSFSATPSAVVAKPTPTEIFIMPATDSGELHDAGTLPMTIALVLGGISLVIFGKMSKKWMT